MERLWRPTEAATRSSSSTEDTTANKHPLSRPKCTPMLRPTVTATRSSSRIRSRGTTTRRRRRRNSRIRRTGD